jgi:trk system potassium uptake protein TrkA
MKRFVVCGLGQFGWEVARALYEKGAEVIAVDKDMGLVENIKGFVTTAININTTDEEALRSLNLQNIDAAIVSIGEDWESSILTTAILKELGIEQIIARRAGSIHGRILEKVGATKVISPEINIADQLARNLVSTGILEHIPLPDDHIIIQVEAREEFFDKTLIELDFRRNYGLLVVGIKRLHTRVGESGEVYEETEAISLPSATEAIKENDILMLVGKKEDIEEFMKASGE